MAYMPLKEIPVIVLQRFAVWCATDCLKYYENNYPDDKKLHECIQLAEKYHDQAKADELVKMRESVSVITVGGAAGRAAASAIAALFSILDPNSASWANAAAHLTAVATDTAMTLVDAQSKAHNVATAVNAANIADNAAIAAHRAAAAGAIAHDADVTASRNTTPARYCC